MRGPRLVLQKDKGMVLKKKGTWQGGGWGLGYGDREVVIRKWDRHAVETHVPS